MQGGATRAMPGRIGEERRRRRRPRAAATARGGWPFAPHSFAAKKFLFKKASLPSPVAKSQTRRPHPFFSSLLVLRPHAGDEDAGDVLEAGREEPPEARSGFGDPLLAVAERVGDFVDGQAFAAAGVEELHEVC